MKALFLAALALATVGCGRETDSAVADAIRGTASDPAVADDTQNSYLKGAVTPAFELTVDGESYRDSEDFYTAELERLPSKIEAAGIDLTGLEVRFAAKVGLTDLPKGMTVHAIAQGIQGTAGMASVRSDGTFAIPLPKTKEPLTVQVRATKRISIELVRGQKVEKKFCYTLSAQKSGLKATEFLVLSDFQTSLTKYECSTNEKGLIIK